MRILRKNQKGFTLVEIMIVVAIIGLLAAMAIPNFIKARQRSRDNICVNNMKQIAGAIEQVAMEENLTLAGAGAITWNAAPGAGTFGVVGAIGYLKTAPICPATGTYGATGDAVGNVVLTCSGVGHNTTAMYNTAAGFVLQ